MRYSPLVLIVLLAISTPAWAQKDSADCDELDSLGTLGKTLAEVVDFSDLDKGSFGQELNDFGGFLERLGIKKECDADGLAQVVAFLEADRARVKVGLDRDDIDDDLEDLLEDYDDFYKGALGQIENLTADKKCDRCILEACQIGKDAIYTLLGMQQRDQEGGPGRKLTNLFLVASRFIFRSNSFPYTKPEDRNKPIGLRQARRESKNLVDPNDSSRFLTPEELATMSTYEIAALDVSPDHSAWNTEVYLSTHDVWTDIENHTVARVEKKIEEPYDLHEARRVLVFDKIKSSATSPKVNVEDLQGQDWKLKWGEEAGIEPVLNRIYVQLGGKWTDLVYNDVGGTSHRLILGSKEDQADKPDECVPTTEEEFITCMKESEYDFNVRPHILERGFVRGGEYDGRQWLTFRESMTESKHKPATKRGGPVDLFTPEGESDRAWRGMALFSLWVEATDSKEDNHRTALLEDFAGAEGPQLVSFFHDTGSTLGGIGIAGELNKLSTSGSFLWLNDAENALLSRTFFLYKPGAWGEATFADLLWMARKITSLSQEDLAAAAVHSKWPAFMQDVMVHRLAVRRDRIAQMFGLSVADPAGEAPSLKIALTTRKDREDAAEAFDLDVDDIEAAMREGGMLGRTWNDHILRKGKVNACDRTILLGLIRDAHYPTGFSDRTNRRGDGKDYEPCRYIKPSDRHKPGPHGR